MRKIIVKNRDGEWEGLFHGWFLFGDLTNGVEPHALVEFADGRVDYFCAGYVRFAAPPEAIEKGA